MCFEQPLRVQEVKPYIPQGWILRTNGHAETSYYEGTKISENALEFRIYAFLRLSHPRNGHAGKGGLCLPVD